MFLVKVLLTLEMGLFGVAGMGFLLNCAVISRLLHLAGTDKVFLNKWPLLSRLISAKVPLHLRVGSVRRLYGGHFLTCGNNFPFRAGPLAAIEGVGTIRHPLQGALDLRTFLIH